MYSGDPPGSSIRFSGQRSVLPDRSVGYTTKKVSAMNLSETPLTVTCFALHIKAMWFVLLSFHLVVVSFQMIHTYYNYHFVIPLGDPDPSYHIVFAMLAL